MLPLTPLKRGAILTDAGCQKLTVAIQAYYQGQNLRVNAQRIAQHTGLRADEIIGIRQQQWLAKRQTLKQLFQAFGLELKRSDCQRMRRLPEPRFAPMPAEQLPIALGREELVEQLAERLLSETTWAIALTGIAGIGKRTVAIALSQFPPLKAEYPLVIAVELSQVWAGMATIARQVLGEAIAKTVMAQSGMPGLIQELVMKLQSQPILLWLQQVPLPLLRTELFQHFWQLIMASPTLRSRLILTLETAEPLPNERDRCPVIHLEGLDDNAIAHLYEQWGIDLRDTAQQQALQTIHQAYQGHPLALKWIAGEIRSFPYYGNLWAYWQDYGYEYELTPATAAEPAKGRDLQDWLFTLGDRTLQRLASYAPLAVDLLYLGAMNSRFTPAYGWQFLIGDVTPAQQVATLAELETRLLVETIETPQGNAYRVHPILRKIITDTKQATA